MALQFLSQKAEHPGYSLERSPDQIHFSAIVDCLIQAPIRGQVYNFPMRFTFPFNYPSAPPHLKVVPTSNMYIPNGHPYVYPDGTVNLLILQNWTANTDFPTIYHHLLQAFAQKSPLFAKPQGQQQSSLPKPPYLTPSTANQLGMTQAFTPNPTPAPVDPLRKQLAGEIGRRLNEDVGFIISECNRQRESLQQCLRVCTPLISDLNKDIESKQAVTDDLTRSISFFEDRVPQIQNWIDEHPSLVDENGDICAQLMPKEPNKAKMVKLSSSIRAFQATTAILSDVQCDEQNLNDLLVEYRQLCRSNFQNTVELLNLGLADPLFERALK
ncbi:hypothetical protein BLNAU_2884 [Blattamonas nauphoetae]|uniref:UEV domain-containing protein n=1 Tax=Blattamonas nauphoetae TaxID=2049346 RepID=A0ABQ9YF62_9EUKA|nr:hypothetical protein BLNAU_2884 [Blattamonas nauphoetae]